MKRFVFFVTLSREEDLKEQVKVLQERNLDVSVCQALDNTIACGHYLYALSTDSYKGAGAIAETFKEFSVIPMVEVAKLEVFSNPDRSFSVARSVEAEIEADSLGEALCKVRDTQSFDFDYAVYALEGHYYMVAAAIKSKHVNPDVWQKRIGDYCRKNAMKPSFRYVWIRKV